jgi:hypothetical protein
LSSGDWARLLITSSVRPSAKKPSDGCSEKLAKGRTATDLDGAPAKADPSLCPDPSFRLASCIIAKAKTITTTAPISQSIQPNGPAPNRLWSRGTIFTPSGVISNIQARTTATGKPARKSRAAALTVQGGISSAGNMALTTWNTAQPATA